MRATNGSPSPGKVLPDPSSQLRGSFSQRIDFGRLKNRAAVAAVASGVLQGAHSQLSHCTTSSDTAEETPPRWLRCNAAPTTDRNKTLKSKSESSRFTQTPLRHSSLSGSSSDSDFAPLPSPPSKRFEFRISDGKNSCSAADTCHLRVRRRQQQQHQPHQLHHHHHHFHHHRRRHQMTQQQRHSASGVRFNAFHPVSGIGHVSFQYISKLFQPWLWNPPKKQKPASDGDLSDDGSDEESESGLFTMLLVALLLLVIIGAIVYVASHPEVLNNFGMEFVSRPSQIFDFENNPKIEVTGEVAEMSECEGCKVGVKSVQAPPVDEDTDAMGLEKYLRKKARRIVSKFNR